ncbi:uncharacterized protein LOC130638095 [Hydractinia symbiolongicarpus]|uniref:uncharacterized protein LOC130638095 n=1 Tax=Hydractinia symbiolongicarpus TaxID=13093 RepID=UPI00254EFC63|nr:uncharacterized protein LOC130638095 [Hydractinia symbiolongicarpus]
MECASKIPFWRIFRMEGIECAIWPCKYYNANLCESTIEGGSGRLSAKKAFILKCCSEIIDYSVNFELLQYQYDRWMYKTVSGAIESGKKFGSTPVASLDRKIFSSGYWKWQHRYLLDAVRQFGYPKLFMTISPYEWTFPKVLSL